jgi:Periplasmic copper-binding protein (NosD)
MGLKIATQEDVMKRSIGTKMVVCVGLFVALAQSAIASNVAVGTCKSGVSQFPTIQAAVNAVPPLSTINVCPGIYQEQVVIVQPLTLTGVPGAGQAIVAAPATGLVPNFSTLAGQITVQGTASVTIRDLVVDGSNNGIVPCAATPVGILFENASGLVDQVVTRYQTIPANVFCDGRGIEVRSDSGLTSTVTIQNSTVHNFQFEGIRAFGVGTNVTAKNNSVSGVPFSGTSTNNIDYINGATGKILQNSVADAVFSGAVYPNFNGAAWGILLECASGVTVSGNTISNTQSGIVLLSSVCTAASAHNSDNNTISTNNITGSHLFEGIYVCGNNNVVQNNVINSSDESAVDIATDCNPGVSGQNNTVTLNKINEACGGILLDPAATGTTIGSNKFANVSLASLSGVIGANVCDAPGTPGASSKNAPSD